MELAVDRRGNDLVCFGSSTDSDRDCSQDDVSGGPEAVSSLKKPVDCMDALDSVSPQVMRIDDAKISQRGKSKAVAYFKMMTKGRYVCKICKEKNPWHEVIIKRNSQGSTTNFWRHLKKVHRAIHDKLKGISSRHRSATEVFKKNSNDKQNNTRVSWERSKHEIVRFICLANMPWSLTDRKAFRSLLRYCVEQDLDIPCARTLRDAALKMHELEKEKLCGRLAPISQVSVTVDAWTTENQIPLLGIAVHWVDDTWTLHEQVLSIAQLFGPQTGENMAEVLLQRLEDFGVQSKVCAVTTNSENNYTTMVEALVTSLKDTNPKFNKERHMSCLVNIINLVVQEGMKRLEIPPAPLVTVLTKEIVEDSATHKLFWAIAPNSLGEVVVRVRQLIAAIHTSPQLLSQYMDFCKDLGVPNNNKPVPDVSTEWNSTHQMMIDAYEKRQVLNKMAAIVFSSNKKNCCITDAQWQIVLLFVTILRPFRDATIHLCDSKTVTATEVLKVISALVYYVTDQVDKLEQGVLFPEGAILSKEQRTLITTTCTWMTEEIKKYEGSLNRNYTFSFAAILDPQIKLSIVPLADRDAILANLFKLITNAKDDEISIDDKSSHQDTYDFKATTNVITKCIISMRKRQTSKPEMSIREELEGYLHAPCVEEDALSWWKREGCLTFPKLAVIAKEYLSICGASAPSKWFFQVKKGITSCKWSRLNVEGTSTLATLKCWVREEDSDSEIKEIDGSDEEDNW